MDIITFFVLFLVSLPFFMYVSGIAWIIKILMNNAGSKQECKNGAKIMHITLVLYVFCLYLQIALALRG